MHSPNHKSAYRNSAATSALLHKELAADRLLGPFQKILSQLRLSAPYL
jgi:hypothetical protein